MLLFCCPHLTLSYFQFHDDNFLYVLVLLSLHIIDFSFMSDFHFLEFLFEVGDLSFKHVDLSLLLSNGIVVLFEVFFLQMFLICLKGLKWWDSNECSFLSFPFERVIDQLDFAILLLVFLLKLCDFILESFIILF